MTFLQRIARYWQNTKSMPFLLRLLTQGAMVAAPILLLFLVLPIGEWKVNGHRISYAELWSSGQSIVIAVWLVLIATGAWGLAARNSASRWLLILSPVAPYPILAILPAAASEPLTLDAIVSAALTAAVLYFCLFRLGVVREYFRVN